MSQMTAGQRPGELGDQLSRPVWVVRDHRIDEPAGRFGADASARATTFGVKALLTMLRSRRCRGSSSTIIDPKNSASSGFWSGIVMDGLELKRCG